MFYQEEGLGFILLFECICFTTDLLYIVDILGVLHPAGKTSSSCLENVKTVFSKWKKSSYGFVIVQIHLPINNQEQGGILAGALWETVMGQQGVF